MAWSEGRPSTAGWDAMVQKDLSLVRAVSSALMRAVSGERVADSDQGSREGWLAVRWEAKREVISAVVVGVPQRETAWSGGAVRAGEVKSQGLAGQKFILVIWWETCKARERRVEEITTMGLHSPDDLVILDCEM